MKVNTDNITIRTEIKPGDLGYITYLHGILYDQEYNYDYNFERYVAMGLNEFLQNYNHQKDRLWVVEDNNKIIGSILIMGRSGAIAQLRYFILIPEFRGIGLGKKLMQLAMDFCKSTGYKSIYLWTTQELHAAAHLYKLYGFKKTKQVPSKNWGKAVIEDCYDTLIS